MIIFFEVFFLFLAPFFLHDVCAGTDVFSQISKCAKRWAGKNLNPSRWWMPAGRVWGELGCGWWCRWWGAPPTWWWLWGCLWAGWTQRHGGLHGKEGQTNGAQVQRPLPRGHAREQIVLMLLPVAEWKWQFRCWSWDSSWGVVSCKNRLHVKTAVRNFFVRKCFCAKKVQLCKNCSG